MAEDVQVEQKQVEGAMRPEEDKKSESRPHTVSRERIERLHEMINGSDKGSNSKKDK